MRACGSNTGTICQGAEAAGADAKNMGVEETDLRRPILSLQETVQKLEQEIDKIMMEKLR